MQYRISQKAAEDLENIWLYTFQNWSLEQADKYLNILWDEIAHLAQHPETGKNYYHIKEQYRCAKVKSHLIFYKISTTNIEIIRVLHQKMDIINRLME